MLPPCPICDGPRRVCFHTQILGQYDADYWFCPACGLVQPETPTWLDEAYSSAITKTDIGLVGRNVQNCRKIACLLFFCFGTQGRYLDIGGGYGLFVRLMRDTGFDYYWADEYCQNIFAQGLEAEHAEKPFTGLSAFEVMEHIGSPLAFIRDNLRQTEARTLIFSQELYRPTPQGEPPAPGDWWYYSPAIGQHISLYQARTLDTLAGKLGLRRYSYQTTHIFTDKKLNSRLLPVLLGKPSLALHESHDIAGHGRRPPRRRPAAASLTAFRPPPSSRRRRPLPRAGLCYRHLVAVATPLISRRTSDERPSLGRPSRGRKHRTTNAISCPAGQSN